MFRPIITLTTDFGLADHYVGTMKGVILSRCPQASVVDISHDIAPFSIAAGAYAIDQAARFYPSGTVHVVVIDPGVGTPRRPILVEADQSFFIAPDNGVLSLVLARSGGVTAREILNRDLWLSDISTTFHGRDIFAPSAAALASRAVQPPEFGPLIADVLRLEDLNPVAIAPGVWQGKVQSVDRFGNVITNFTPAHWAGNEAGTFRLETGRAPVISLHSTFGAAAGKEAFGYWGSSGYLEIGVNQGNASATLGLHPGDRLSLHIAE